MKNAMNNTKRLLMALLVIMAFACSKDGEDGMDGAIGPQGEQGPAGQDGIDGEDGNANIIASDWIVATNDIFGVTAEMDIPISDLEPSSLENGVLLVYMRQEGFSESLWPSGQITLLPLTLESGGSTFIFNYFFTSENLKIRFHRNPVVEFISFPTGSEFRYVIIPPMLSTSEKNNTIDFNKMTYEEVMNHFGQTL